MKNILTILGLLLSSICFSQAVKTVQVSPAGEPVEPAITPNNTAKKLWNGFKSFTTNGSDSIVEQSTNLFFTNGRVDTRLNGYTGDVTFLNGASTIGNLKVINAMIAAGTIDLTTKVTGLLPDGNISSAGNWNTAFGWGNHASAGYLTSAIAASTYQPILVSGTNIKTVNSNSLLGSGNISVGTLVGADTVYSAAKIAELTDTAVSHLARLSKNSDSLNAHNTRIGANTYAQLQWTGDTTYYAVPPDSSWFFGTSVTAGSGITTLATNASNSRYVDIVASAINTHPINKGIGGTSMRVGSAGDSSMVERIPIIPVKLATRRYLGFEYGYNDAATTDTAGFRSSTNKVLDSAITARGWPAGSIILIPAAYRTQSAAAAARDTQYRFIYREIALQRGCIFADIHTPTDLNLSMLQTDGTHPNSYGHSLLGKAVTTSLPGKKSGFFYEGGTLAANRLAVNGQLINPVNDTAIIAEIRGTASIKKNN